MLKLVALRVEPSEYQKSVLEQLDGAAGTEEKETRKGLKRRPKGPNPLSVKKSTKMRGSARLVLSRGGVSRSKVHILSNVSDVAVRQSLSVVFAI